jgi:hypothetical protein
LLRIDFHARPNVGSLEDIDWKDFFEKFEDKRLALVYQDRTATGRPSRFAKFVNRERQRAPARRDVRR